MGGLGHHFRCAKAGPFTGSQIEQHVFSIIRQYLIYDIDFVAVERRFVWNKLWSDNAIDATRN